MKWIYVLSVLAGLLAVAAASPAHAAERVGAERDVSVMLAYDWASPYKTYYGADDVPYRCADDASTVRYAYGSEGELIELRYSRRCRTVWARGPMWAYIKVESFFPKTGDRRAMAETGANPNYPGTHYTVMLNDADLLGRACDFARWETCTGTY